MGYSSKLHPYFKSPKLHGISIAPGRGAVHPRSRAMAAVLASVAKNAGEALATAQTTTTLQGQDRATTATNVTGNQGAFIAGRAVVDGATMIAQWYLDYAKQLIPSIAVGSGETVHVVMLDTIRVPVLAGEG